MTQRDAATAADVSDTTWLSVEQGKKVSNRTLARVERAMQWPAGVIDAVLAGKDPSEWSTMLLQGAPTQERTFDEPPLVVLGRLTNQVDILREEVLRLRSEVRDLKAEMEARRSAS